MDVSLVPTEFIPTSSFSGQESPTVLRGKNAVIRAASGRSKIENYPGSKNLAENYDIDAVANKLTGTITWTVDETTPVGTSTLFTTECHIGQTILIGREPCVVNRIIDDTHIITDRPCTATQTGVTARYMLSLHENNRQRGVMKRGNSITIDKKDIVFAGDGPLYLNGVSTTFTATRRPRRLQRDTAGTYTEFAIGFDIAPPPPVITPSAGGWKKMQAGNYSFMISYWNSITKEFSNPCSFVKKDGGGTDIIITAGQRFEFDFTTSLVGMPANADGFIIWGSQSGGGVVAVNTSNFEEGAWLEVKKIRTTASAFADAQVSTGNDTITVSGHKFKTADSVYFAATWGPFTAGTEYFAIVVDGNTLKFATTAVLANAGTAIDIAGLPGGLTTLRAIHATNDKTFIEYLDAEMGATASADNDPPPDCEFVAEFANQLFCISSLGKTTSTKALGTSPGNYVMPSKVSNFGAFPSGWRVSVGDEITGFANGIGRMFCLTANGLPFVTPTGRTELARLSPTLLDMPFTSRPFWTKGGINPYNLIVVQGDVFVYTGRTLLRSPSNADTNVIPYEIGLPVGDLTASWYDGHAFLGHCGKNQQICIISSATHKNAAGYWVSQILPYSLQKNEWQPIVEVSSDTRDMIVSGVATVNGRMEFLAGGYTAAAAYTMSTFRYDEATSGTAVPWYIAFQPSDIGEDAAQKMIRSFRVTGRTSAAIIQVHGGVVGDGEISITDIEAGSNSVSGNISVPASVGLEREKQIKQLVKNLTLFTVRYSDEWPGTGSVNRLDELVLDLDVHGVRQ